MENNRYNNSKIYKMYDMINGYFYIGSTSDKLSKRFSNHKPRARLSKDMKVYKCFNEIGWENVKIVLMEEHYLENKEQQLREEDRVIQMYFDDPKCLNSLRPFVPEEEQTRQQKEKMKEYYQSHKNEHLEYNKISRGSPRTWIPIPRSLD